MRPTELIGWLEQRGWFKERSAKGSHLVFRFPASNAFFIIPFRFSDSGRRVLNMKTAIKRLEKNHGRPVQTPGTHPTP